MEIVTDHNMQVRRVASDTTTQGPVPMPKTGLARIHSVSDVAPMSQTARLDDCVAVNSAPTSRNASPERDLMPSGGGRERLSSNSSTGTLSKIPSTSPMGNRGTNCRRTLRGLQKNFNSSKQEDEKPIEAEYVERPLSLGTTPVVTVQSKITGEQLERVKTLRHKKDKSNKVDKEKEKASLKRKKTMPSRMDIEIRFNAILEALDLPEEQIEAMHTCTLERKWQMICDFSQKEEDPTHTPRFFTEKLWAVIADQNFKDASQLIKRMEIIMRGAQINWLNVLLSPPVNGLNAILSLLENMQVTIKKARAKAKCGLSDDKATLATLEAAAKMEKSKSKASIRGKPTTQGKKLAPSRSSSSITSRTSIRNFRGRPKRMPSTTTDQVSLTDLSLPFDYPTLAHDICLVLRAMMNTEIGFMAVAEHKTALNTIAGCIIDTQPKTQIVALEILTAMCMIESIHTRVVEAMDYSRKLSGEEYRFQRLVQCMKDPDMSNDYIISLLNFFNVVVHAAPNVNFRVHLQYDLTSLGFDECLGDFLQQDDLDPLLGKQINAYVDNFFDVQTLLDNFDNPQAGAFTVAKAETQRDNERLQEELKSTETRYVAKVAELEDSLRDMRRTIEMLTEADQDASRRPSLFDGQRSASGSPTPVKAHLSPTLVPAVNAAARSEDNADAAATGKGDTAEGSKETPAAGDGTSGNGSGGDAATGGGDASGGDGSGGTGGGNKTENGAGGNGTSAESGGACGGNCGGGAGTGGEAPAKKEVEAPPAPPPPVSIPPPPPPMSIAPPPPPGPGGAISKGSSKRKAITTKYKMPALNWQAIRNTTWNSTIFAHCDSDFHQLLDTSDFEEKFKLKNQPTENNDGKPKQFVRQNVKSAKVLDGNFCRNIGILQRKLGMTGKELAEKINKYTVSTELADVLGQLLKLQPSDSDLQKLERHEKNNTTKTLADEEIFMLELHRVPRFTTKVRVIMYMMSFKDTVDMIQPQLQSLYVACSAVTSSSALKKMYELLLTLGNLTNSSRRGWTNGFQVASLDVIKSMRSTDGSMNLMNYLADYIKERKEYNNLFNELVGLDRASTVTLTQISSEISQLVSGLLMIRAEAKKDKNHLGAFTDNAKQVVPDLEKLYRRAQEAFGDVIVYLGESAKSQTPAEILGPLSRFIRNLQAASRENEQAGKKAVEAAKKKAVQTTHRETADALNDLLKKGNPLKTKLTSQTSIGGNRQRQNTFMDDILNASKTVAYRAEVKGR